MHDQNENEQTTNNRRGYIPARCVSFIEKLQRQTNNQSGAKQGDQTANDRLITITGRLVNATWVIAVVGAFSFGASLLQWCAMRSTDEATHIAATAAQNSATAAVAANETTRALIGAALIIPDEPSSKVRIGLDGTVALDLYITDLGQSWARDVYINARIIIPSVRTTHGQSPAYDQTVFAGGFDVSPQIPWHYVLDDFAKYPFAADAVDNLTVSVKIEISFFNIFKEPGSQSTALIAATGAANTPCCTIGKLDKFIALQRPMDSSRVHGAGSQR